MPAPYRTPTGRWDIPALRAGRAAGLTLAQLGQATGVSRERIRSLLVRAAARERCGLPIDRLQSRMAESARVSQHRPAGSSGTCGE